MCCCPRVIYRHSEDSRVSRAVSQGMASGWILGKIPSLKGLSSPGTGCSDGVSVPGGIYLVCRCGTWGQGLVVTLTVLGEWLDSILEGFQPKSFHDGVWSQTCLSLLAPKEAFPWEGWGHALCETRGVPATRQCPGLRGWARGSPCVHWE